jgi:hypothetical protein
MEVMGFSFVRIRYVSCHDGCGHTMALPDGILLRDPHEVGADPSARCQDGLKCGVPQWINPPAPGPREFVPGQPSETATRT